MFDNEDYTSTYLEFCYYVYRNIVEKFTLNLVLMIEMHSFKIWIDKMINNLILNFYQLQSFLKLFYFIEVQLIYNYYKIGINICSQ